MTILATVEKLAPTGEGVVRTKEGVGLVSGALPGEDVEVEIVRASRKIWRGRTVSIRTGSALRRTGGHADGCPACDWAHLDLSAAREAKRELFLETMARIGKLRSEIFGALPVEPSPLGYRLRSRFHAQPRAGATVVGAFAPGTHRVEPLDQCLALAAPARASLPALSQSLSAAGAISAEIATIETLD
ncbi:MAG: TRAM domain-containing protein, partial [Acidobacteriota bacterium]|nr:TRAM domain-containing protein [Acidobacteriota bacterium]